MSQSIIEIAQSDLIAELQTITVANGYRNTVVNVSAIIDDPDGTMTLPQVRVFFETGSIKNLGSAFNSFQEWVDVQVEARVMIVDAESMIHDLKKCLSSYILTHLNDSTRRYLIRGRSENELFKIFRVFQIKGEPKGIVGIQFRILVHNEGTDF